MEISNNIEYQEPEFIAEYTGQTSSKNYITKNKPTNSLDYMKLNSEDYLKFKLELRVKEKIKCLNIDEKYLKEIFEIINLNYKIFKNSMRISDIIPIVIYKIIKRYNLPIANNEIFEKLVLNKSKYLKLSNKIIVECDRNKSELEIEESFKKNLLSLINFMILKLNENYRMKPNSLKIKIDLIILENCINNYKSTSYIDSLKYLEEIKQEARVFILEKREMNNFYDYFHNKILLECLAAAIVKYLLDKKGIKINLQTFRENFNIAISSISKASKMIQEYLKLIY